MTEPKWVSTAELIRDGYVPGRAAARAEIEAFEADDQDNMIDEYEPSFATELRENGLL